MIAWLLPVLTTLLCAGGALAALMIVARTKDNALHFEEMKQIDAWLEQVRKP